MKQTQFRHQNKMFRQKQSHQRVCLPRVSLEQPYNSPSVILPGPAGYSSSQKIVCPTMHCHTCIMFVRLCIFQLPKLTTDGNVGSGVYYTGKPGSGQVTKRGLMVESSVNEEKVGQCFAFDDAMFKDLLGAETNQTETRRNWHAAAKIAEARWVSNIPLYMIICDLIQKTRRNWTSSAGSYTAGSHTANTKVAARCLNPL